VYQLRATDAFGKWLRALGDAQSVGGGVSEMRVDVGAGYRVYFTRRQRVILVLLCGGDKSSQTKDIARAKQMAKTVE